jgi:hypothetical protein
VSIRFIAVAISLVLAAGCAEAPQIDLRAVYDRTDRDFDSAVMFRPDDSHEELPGFLMAPLIVLENGEAGRAAPEVSYEQTDDGWVYRWKDPVSGHEQGLRLTLGEDGFPLAYEALHDSSGARLLFIDIGLEEQAGERFGRPLDGRRHAVERSVEETPDVAVGGLLEPGSTPLGPFVYLWEGTHDVNVVLCRCMAPRVYDIKDSIPYGLTPYIPSSTDEAPRRAALSDLLRLPS